MSMQQPFATPLGGGSYKPFAVGGPGAPPTQLDPNQLANWQPQKPALTSLGKIVGTGHSDAFSGGSFTVIRLNRPLTVYRYFGGSAPEEGTRFVDQRAAANADARQNYGTAREPGNDVSRIASATIPAGTLVRVGDAAPGRTPEGVYGGAGLVELVHPSDVTRVDFGHTHILSAYGKAGSPFGDGPANPFGGGRNR